MSDELPDDILQVDDVEGPFHAKIGTFTPQLIWIHKDDLPVEKGDKFRFVKTDPNDKHENWGSEQKAGIIDESRDHGGEELLFVTEEGAYIAEKARQNADNNTENK